MADVNVKGVQGVRGDAGGGELVAHDFAVFAAAGTEAAGAAGRVHGNGREKLDGPGVIDDGVRAVAGGGIAAAFGRLISAVGIHSGDAVEGIESADDGRDGDWIAGRFFQG